MTNLSVDFNSKIIDVGLQVPLLARQALSRLADMTGAKNICIGGGFVRGLYMQQSLGLSPQMNDIDVFADISPEKFTSVEADLKVEFGHPVRFHIGTFEREENPCGLLEFSLPTSLREQCGGVESLQLNFGLKHPWANALNYIAFANVGMNQIAVQPDGRVFVSQSFIEDMTNKTMTMNARREWSAHDWHRTLKSLERMKKERQEFRDWEIIRTPRPYVAETGTFWESRREQPLLGADIK